MRRVSRALMVTATLCVLVHGAAIGSGAAAQRQRRRAPARPRPAVTSAVDYSKFLHSTKKHQAACVTCHKIPTSNWQKVREYPDVADYPDHDACVSCHRRQFFRGAKPAICSVCHSKVSPRDDERFAFRNPASRRQFLIEFPHDKHQDVIAEFFRRFTEERPRFVRASFMSSSFPAQDKTTHYNNCEICHGPRPAPSIAPASGWVDGFVPDNLTLKSVPVNHSSCFSCHWKSEQPVNDNCAGCHKLPNPPAMIAVADVPTRKSMKFRHGNEKHIEECTTCHINITKATTLQGLKPDVPITACSRCHYSQPSHLEISDELAAIDKNREFVCVYCHTSDVGRRDPPPSHYLSADRPPIRRKDVK
jgi:decaheme cytochrome c component MtrC/MtrF-like protein/class III cytochrome C family protein